MRYILARTTLSHVSNPQCMRMYHRAITTTIQKCFHHIPLNNRLILLWILKNLRDIIIHKCQQNIDYTEKKLYTIHPMCYARSYNNISLYKFNASISCIFIKIGYKHGFRKQISCQVLYNHVERPNSCSSITNNNIQWYILGQQIYYFDRYVPSLLCHMLELGVKPKQESTHVCIFIYRSSWNTL